MPHILLIITGSIAAYKSLDLIRLMKKEEYQVSVVMTESAHQFVTPLSVAALSENPVYDNMFELRSDGTIAHIKLSREVDLILVAPATASIMAKTVLGLADDLASSLLLARDKPVLMAPAMNCQMWENPATKRNLTQLETDGIIIIPPQYGKLACGEIGLAKMAEDHVILTYIKDNLQNTK